MFCGAYEARVCDCVRVLHTRLDIDAPPHLMGEGTQAQAGGQSSRKCRWQLVRGNEAQQIISGPDGVALLSAH